MYSDITDFSQALLTLSSTGIYRPRKLASSADTFIYRNLSTQKTGERI